MNRRIALALLSLCASVGAQQAPSAASSSDANPIFSVGTSLVQLDAEVMDYKHRHVVDLTADDFEVTLDHKRQPISNFTYVRLEAAVVNSASNSAESQAIRPEDVRRSMVIVVDDLSLSFESMAYTRQALHKFLDRGMQPGDLIAIWETGRSNSVFQQFTSDKRVLEAAVDNLRWNPRGRGAVRTFAPDQDASTPGHPPASSALSVSPSRSPSPRQTNNVPNRRDEPSQEEKSYLSAERAMGTLSTISELLDELQTVGGRKAVVLFSDGIDQALPTVDPIAFASPAQQAMLFQMRHLIDKANRSGAVIYTIDARGLLYLTPGQIVAFNGSQDALETLADQTGGFATLNSNGLDDALRQIDEDQKGYYLIGFKAPLDVRTGKPSEKIDFHTLHVRVKRLGLHVRSRKGFWSETDEAARPKFGTPQARMRLAMMSLFNRSDIHMGLTALYVRTEDGKPEVRNLLYVNARDISFETTSAGKHKATLELAIIASGYGIDPLAQAGRVIEIDATDEQLRQLQKNGILLTMDVPMQRPGPYQIRASVLDSSSKAIGSAGQYIDVPDLKKRHVALTTPLIGEVATNTGDDASKVMALRQFHAGDNVSFLSVIATDHDAALRAKDFNASMQLYTGGKILTQVAIPVAGVRGQSVHALRGQMSLPSSLPLGQYYLEAVVTEHSGKSSHLASSWIDFQVVQ